MRSRSSWSQRHPEDLVSSAAIEPILEVEGLRKEFYLHEQGARIRALDSVCLMVWPGLVTGLAGPSGCGKSSVLKCIYRTYLPNAGRIHYRRASGAMVDLAAAPEDLVGELRDRDIGFVTQFLHCLPRQPALQVVAKPLVVRGTRREAAADAAANVLDRLRLPKALWSVPPATMSGGERQKVNLARGVLAGTRLLLLDEPTAGLDERSVELALELMRERRNAGVGIIAIFHDPVILAQSVDVRVTLAPVTGDSGRNGAQ